MKYIAWVLLQFLIFTKVMKTFTAGSDEFSPYKPNYDQAHFYLDNEVNGKVLPNNNNQKIKTRIDIPHKGAVFSGVDNLPEGAIYCTQIPKADKGPYQFLAKYYKSITGHPANYRKRLECIYPQSLKEIEMRNGYIFPTTTTAAPKPDAVDVIAEVMRIHTDDFLEYRKKVDRGEKVQPPADVNIDALVDMLMQDIFTEVTTKTPAIETLRISSPYGIICEYLDFPDDNISERALIVRRPICYPAKLLPFTRSSKEAAISRETFHNMCSVLCVMNVIYTVFPCCQV